jgi:hypothetical protein
MMSFQIISHAHTQTQKIIFIHKRSTLLLVEVFHKVLSREMAEEEEEEEEEATVDVSVPKSSSSGVK